MKFKKRESDELGEWWEPEPPPYYGTIVATVVLGALILFLEFTGLADYIISSFE